MEKKMQLIVNKPVYSSGVYIAIHFIEKKAYVGETNDLFRRFGEHICGIAGCESHFFYSSNDNLKSLDDKRILLIPVYEVLYPKTENKREAEARKYAETVCMYIMRKYGFSLYNKEKDNAGRTFLIEGSDDLEMKTVEYLYKKTVSFYKDEYNEDDIKSDIVNFEDVLKEQFSNLFNIDIDDIPNYSKEELEQIWENNVVKKANVICKGKDALSHPFCFITSKKEAMIMADEISGRELSIELFDRCGLKTISKTKLADMIRSKKFDTTVFTTFGAYLKQMPATILATKTEDLKNHKLIKTNESEWKINTCDAADKEDGFCTWAFRKLDDVDTRKFFDTTNVNEKEKKYIFLTYTPSNEQAGEKNIKELNPSNGESFEGFKKRIQEYIVSEGMERYANIITVNSDDNITSQINIPESLFPEVIEPGLNRGFLISNLYVLDGYVEAPGKIWDYYWYHYRGVSDNGYEKPEETIADKSKREEFESDNYEVTEGGNGKIIARKEHLPICTKYRGSKCGRIRDDDNREWLAQLVSSDGFYVDSKDAKSNYRNIIIAELIYPYVVELDYNIGLKQYLQSDCPRIVFEMKESSVNGIIVRAFAFCKECVYVTKKEVSFRLGDTIGEKDEEIFDKIKEIGEEGSYEIITDDEAETIDIEIGNEHYYLALSRNSDVKQPNALLNDRYKYYWIQDNIQERVYAFRYLKESLDTKHSLFVLDENV